MKRTAPTRRGFTLVELLIVITIIGILASLGVYAASQALDNARRVAMRTELQNLDMAIKDYKSKNGGIPPAMFGVAAFDSVRLKQHIRSRYPRYAASFTDGNRDAWDHFAARADDRYGLDVANLDPAESLVVWLGGFSDSGGGTSAGTDSGGKKLVGFGSNAADPFAVNGTDGTSLGPITQPVLASYEFLTPRLVDRDGDGWFEYCPDARVDAGPAPGYVYFDSRGYYYDADGNGQCELTEINSYTNGAYGSATPYIAKVNTAGTVVTAFQNPKEFQLVCCGLDGVYGVNAIPKLYPDGTNYDKEDEDNIVNFGEHAQIGDALNQ